MREDTHVRVVYKDDDDRPSGLTILTMGYQEFDRLRDGEGDEDTPDTNKAKTIIPNKNEGIMHRRATSRGRARAAPRSARGSPVTSRSCEGKQVSSKQIANR